MEDHQIRTLLDLHDQVIDQDEFKDANQLLQDFFNEVDAVLKEVRLR